MHPKYQHTLQQILAWAQAESSIHAVLLIGSQARAALPSDRWSDLDLMVLVDDPRRWLDDSAWPARFGEVVCCFTEVTPLGSAGWDWCVKRVLYADDRDVDFSILPQSHLDDVLAVNRDILARGWQVLYEADPGTLEPRLHALLGQGESIAPTPAPQAELDGVISELLYHVIWAYKKICRGELWVAVGCINCHMRGLLLRLVEASSAALDPRPDPLGYSGRFLEQRAAPQVLDLLAGCFTRYDEAEAIQALQRYLDLIHPLAQALYHQQGWPLDESMFARVQQLFAAMQAEV